MLEPLQEDFVIPLHDDDLIAKGYGQDDYSPDDLKNKIQDFADVLDGEDSAVELTSFFDVFYSCIRQKDDINIVVLTLTWEILLKCHMKHLGELSETYLPDIVETGQHISDGNRRDHLNALQMNVYLLCRLAELFENVTKKAAEEEIILDTKKRGKKKSACVINKNPLKDWDWEGAKGDFLNAMIYTFQLAVRTDAGQKVYCLRHLWSPPFIESSLTDIIISATGTVLETPDNACLKDLLNPAFTLFRWMLNMCDCTTAVTSKILQLVQHLDSERGIILIAEGIGVMTEDKKGPWDNFFSALMREFGEMDSDDVGREGGTAKAYGCFLVNLSLVCPAHMLPHISYLMTHMDGESYMMRNAVLTVLTELVLALLGGENRTDAQKLRRDRLLEKVEEHILDVNAFTRSKCIQLWTRLFEEDGVPLSRLHTALPLIAGRLQDKASTVRKAAMHFMTTVLRKNPYRDKLNLEELKELKIEAMKKVEESRKDDNDRLLEKCRKMWGAIEGGARTNIRLSEPEMEVDETDEVKQKKNDPDREMNEEEQQSEENAMEVDAPEVGAESKDDQWFLMKIYGLLSKKEFSEAQKLLLKLFEYAGTRNSLFADWTKEKLNDAESGRELIVSAFEEIFIHVSFTTLQQEAMENEGPENEADALERRKEELMHRERALQYLEDTYKFAEGLQEMLPKVCNMFKSNQTTDVLEAVDFVVACAEFNVPGSRPAVRRLCNLIWRKDSVIREAVVKAFKTLFLDVDNLGNKKNCSLLVAQNLIEMTMEANSSETASMEEVVAEMMTQGLLKKEVLNVFWEYFMMSVPDGCTQEQSQAAVKLIAMVAKAEKTVISANLDTLVKYGLGERAEKDFGFGKDVCYALQMLGVKVDLKSEESLQKEPFRLQRDHLLFQRLSKILLEGSDRFNDDQWSVFMEQAVNVIFFLSEHPDKIAARLVEGVVKKMVQDLARLETRENSEAELSRAKSCYLVRLLTLVGHVALRVLIHLDVAYCGELKRRAFLTELMKSPSRRRKSFGTPKTAASDDSTFATPQSNRDTTCEDEMGLAGAAAEDLEQEIAAKICDEEVLSDRSVLGKLKPLVVEICMPENWPKYSPQVQTAAALTLSKMMLVSHKFCSDSLRMFFTMMRKSPISGVRANLIIAAGDLCSRFPNDIEQWSSYLYAMLYDPDQCVRQNCLLVLTHLILNDMIKPKGKVANIALVTLDPKKEMSGLAKRFFSEMAQKGDTVYKLLPDIISQLTEPDENRTPEEVKKVMKFLLQFIQKEKHCENLVEKICQRFQAVNSVAQWQYLSYCLAQLPQYSEKSLRKLQDNLDKLADKLGDPEVYEHFQSILTAAKKGAKIESKAVIEDLEEQISQLHSEKFEDKEAAERAKTALRRKSQDKKKRSKTQNIKTPARSPSRRTRRKQMDVQEENSSE